MSAVAAVAAAVVETATGMKYGTLRRGLARLPIMPRGVPQGGQRRRERRRRRFVHRHDTKSYDAYTRSTSKAASTNR